jgi:hypothetical protein
VRDRKAAGVDIGIERLNVFECRLACRGIAVVPDGHRAFEPVDDIRVVEVVADEAEVALDVELLAIIGDDAGRFLSAMLQGVEPERRDRCCVWMSEYTEHAALFAQPVVAHLRQAEIRKRVVLSSERPFVRHGCLPLKHPPQLWATLVSRNECLP